GVRAASRQMGAAKYIGMDSFDAKVFTEELRELLPRQDQSKFKAQDSGDKKKNVSQNIGIARTSKRFG
ncbi:MAG: hypothetical protein K2X81_29650, partial [Candidatus Obscuribacterales bacterium]|nr:hypothetical protein [Candidatus Obscuribacterales bacterium]